MLSLRGAVRDEAISVFGQRLLRSARNDALALCQAVEVLSHSPKTLRHPRLQTRRCLDVIDIPNLVVYVLPTSTSR